MTAISENKKLIELGKEASKYNNLIVYPPKIMIPTAEEFLVTYNVFIKPEISTFNLILYRDTHIKTQKSIKEAMIEFAKLHVQAAINTCIEEAPSGSSTDTVSYEDVVKALKECYPLENIK